MTSVNEPFLTGASLSLLGWRRCPSHTRGGFERGKVLPFVALA
ncbi:hypothetical protein [Streptomyces xantholiticus]|uniref:Uncharacterized protein n=1 Tax=Streptomyces xantholiticus TaxID=68285 RepID=A0ABV1UWJ8_9ACTN